MQTAAAEGESILIHGRPHTLAGTLEGWTAQTANASAVSGPSLQLSCLGGRFSSRRRRLSGCPAFLRLQLKCAHDPTLMAAVAYECCWTVAPQACCLSNIQKSLLVGRLLIRCSAGLSFQLYYLALHQLQIEMFQSQGQARWTGSRRRC